MMRVLLRHDGSMTKALAALFDRPIVVNVLSEVIDDGVLIRNSVLSADGQKLLYAASQWQVDTYEHYMQKSPNKPIGEVLSGLRVEQFREMVTQEFSVVEAVVYQELGIPEAPVHWRCYKIFSNNLELCQVTEFFSSTLLTPLVQRLS